MDIDMLNMREVRQAIEIAIATRANLCVEGDPGLGKSAIIGAIARDLNLPFRALFGSSICPEDIAIPSKVEATRSLERWLLKPLQDLCNEKRGLLFLDEITDVPRGVWSAFQRMINEREVGDTKIPDGIAIVMACNSALVATGGQDLSWPVVGRITFVKLAPDVGEISDVFVNILAPGATGTLQSLLVDFGGSLDAMPDLIQLAPPASPEAQPWGAPRSWERGLHLVAGALDAGHSLTSRLVRALLTGSVGRDMGSALLALWAVRASLSTMSEICADPMNAKLPQPATFAAIAGVIAQVGLKDAHAGWLYTSRLSEEARIVAGRILTRCPRGQDTSAHAKMGKMARVRVEAEINKARREAA